MCKSTSPKKSDVASTKVLNMKKVSQYYHIDDFPALVHRFLRKYAIFGAIEAQKQGLGPKFSIEKMVIDLKYVKAMYYYDMYYHTTI